MASNKTLKKGLKTYMKIQIEGLVDNVFDLVNMIDHMGKRVG